MNVSCIGNEEATHSLFVEQNISEISPSCANRDGFSLFGSTNLSNDSRPNGFLSASETIFLTSFKMLSGTSLKSIKSILKYEEKNAVIQIRKSVKPIDG